MGTTPDRHPGEQDEEGTVYENWPAGNDPPSLGGLRLVDGAFRARDALGVFPLRGSGGITEEQHEALDTLVHDIDESCYEEFTYDGSRVVSAIVWATSEKLLKIREEQYTYSSGRVSQLVVIQYNGSGVEVMRTTETYVYSSGRLVNMTCVKMVP